MKDKRITEFCINVQLYQVINIREKKQKPSHNAKQSDRNCQKKVAICIKYSQSK